MIQECKDCRFWLIDGSDINRNPDEPNTGQCLRFPPQIVNHDGFRDHLRNGVMPRTQEYNWCGEFQKFENYSVPNFDVQAPSQED